MKPKIHRTPAQKHILIWDVVRKIPKGRVSTYGKIATLCGLLGHARLVGYALHNLPRGSKVPWHRVINSQGKISISNLDGYADTQRKLLRKEGIVFINGTVNLWKYGWPNDMKKKGSR